MAPTHPEQIAAARHLVQWGRVRQGLWHDASKDLLAALGDRHAAFTDMVADLPPPPPLRPAAPPPPAAVPPPITALVPPVPAAPPPVAALPPPPVVAWTGTSAPASAPPVRVVQVAADRTPAQGRPTGTGRAYRNRRLTRASIMLAACLILAVAAAPRLMVVYHTMYPPPPVTNAVTIETEPPGSLVLIDGQDSGKTPLTVTLAVGVHQVELRYRKNVRKLDLDVTADAPVLARVEWVRKPAPRRNARPKRSTAPQAKAAVAGTAVKPATAPPSVAAPPANAPAAPASSLRSAVELLVPASHEPAPTAAGHNLPRDEQ